MAHWWVKGGERWIGLIEELHAAGVKLERIKLLDFATRLGKVCGMAADSQAYEMLGRQAVELADVNANYDKLLGLLASVASGEIKPEWVKVDAKARTWAWQKPAEPAAEPVAAESSD